MRSRCGSLSVFNFFSRTLQPPGCSTLLAGEAVAASDDKAKVVTGTELVGSGGAKQLVSIGRGPLSGGSAEAVSA